MPRVEYIITVVDRDQTWRKSTSGALVRQAGVPPIVAANWSRVRREMSPAGLTRKLKAQRN